MSEPLPLPATPDTVSLVLCSGGLDSVVLVAWAAARAPVQPVYVRSGLAWEKQEIAVVEKLFGPYGSRPDAPPPAGRPERGVRRLAILEFDVGDLYPASHWAIRGTPPAYDTPDEDVFLPGRNILLLAKTSVLASSLGIGRILMGPLAGNPFPDATPIFFKTMGVALSLGLQHKVDIEAPFAALHKADVIRLGRSLGVPLHATLSCMNPKEGLHCGLCSKCRERRDAFAEAGVEDATVYAAPSPRGR